MVPITVGASGKVYYMNPIELEESRKVHSKSRAYDSVLLELTKLFEEYNIEEADKFIFSEMSCGTSTPARCPISNTIRNSLELPIDYPVFTMSDYIEFGGGENKKYLPIGNSIIASFVHRFDNGHYPELNPFNH